MAGYYPKACFLETKGKKKPAIEIAEAAIILAAVAPEGTFLNRVDSLKV